MDRDSHLAVVLALFVQLRQRRRVGKLHAVDRLEVRCRKENDHDDVYDYELLASTPARLASHGSYI
jgi:hypothetical protein